MAVQSYAELFTTLIGWQYYYLFWDILVQTGLIFIPFFVMISKNMIEPMRSQAARSITDTSINRMLLDVIGMTLFISFFVWPSIDLDQHKLSYSPSCSERGSVTANNTGTQFDDAFLLPNAVKVPMFWYAVMSISQGITTAAIAGVGCGEELRQMNVELDLQRIDDSLLRIETQAFFNACYVPSWNKFVRENPKEIPWPHLDTQWMGSGFFLETPGYYDTFRARSAIDGFAYNNDVDWQEGEDSEWGAPVCSVWWTQSNTGLFDKLIEEISPSFWERLPVIGAEDQAVKKLVINTFSTQTLGVQSTSNSGSIARFIGAPFGLFKANLSFAPKMYLLIESLPIIQALILMALYTFLPFMMILGGFRISTMMTIAFALFSVIFWSFLWQLAGSLDDTLVKALYPPSDFGDLNLTQATGSPLEDLVDMIAMVTYVGFPMLWTFFMSMAGSRMGSVMAFVSKSSEPAESAGGAAGSAAGNTVSTATSAATRGIVR